MKGKQEGATPRGGGEDGAGGPFQVPRGLLLSFLDEDAPFGDITSLSVLPRVSCRARIVAREGGVIAGLEEARELFLASGVAFRPLAADGDRVPPGAVLAEVEGPARAVLLVERTALNILIRMSGIATMTRALQDVLDEKLPGARVAATRKTCPGLRLLDKKAVAIGGGDPHRLTLSDGILIKDNHLALVPLEEAIARARAHSCYRKVEVEVESPEMAVRAARAGADILLLDNMTPALVRETIRMLKNAGLPSLPLVEVSGRITPQNIADYAIEGVSLVSVGALTHSVKALDIGLDVVGTGDAPRPARGPAPREYT
ncbi:MAG: carboxylating nicotinate-nucleotide diphosphorylase [Methanolinea sp.]|nr:carboxylating nicotinate-nucleotide diphosphorylase [Methanolinea sp.]